MQLIFPEDISPGDFEVLQNRKCSDRNSKRWCLNDFQPDGGCHLNLIQPIVHGIPTVKTDMTNRSVLMVMEIRNVSGCLAVQ